MGALGDLGLISLPISGNLLADGNMLISLVRVKVRVRVRFGIGLGLRLGVGWDKPFHLTST